MEQLTESRRKSVAFLESLQTRSRMKVEDELMARITRDDPASEQQTASRRNSASLLNSVRTESRLQVEDDLKAWITRDPLLEQTLSRKESVSFPEPLGSDSARRWEGATSASPRSSADRDTHPYHGRGPSGNSAGQSSPGQMRSNVALPEDLTADRMQALKDGDYGVLFENKRSGNRAPSENLTTKDNEAEDDSSRGIIYVLPRRDGDVKSVTPRSSHHLLTDADSLKLSAGRASIRAKALQTCRLVWTFFISNIQLHVILGLSIALLLLVLLDAQGNALVTRLRGGGYYTSPQHIKSAVRSYVEREHRRHPDILGDALLSDPLSSQGKALQEIVRAGRNLASVSSAIGTYVLWTIRYQLSGDEATAGVWSNEDEDGDVCLWRGVQCDNRGQVAALDLEDQEAEGTLPPEVYLLKESLTGFSLEDNLEMGRHDGLLPAFLAQMPPLNSVNVCGTAYRGRDAARAFCASGADKWIWAEFDCECCVPCDGEASHRGEVDK